MVTPHHHIIGPHKSRGRKVLDYLRCVICGLTTNNKKYECCKSSSAPGGRICHRCFEKIPSNILSDCSEWFNFLNPNKLCQICTHSSNTFLPCNLCHREVCIPCIVPETYALWGDTGKDCIICSQCFPPAARLGSKRSSSSDDFFCIICQKVHKLHEKDSWPCYQSDDDLPLIEMIRQGHDFSAPSVSIEDLNKTTQVRSIEDLKNGSQTPNYYSTQRPSIATDFTRMSEIIQPPNSFLNSVTSNGVQTLSQQITPTKSTQLNISGSDPTGVTEDVTSHEYASLGSTCGNLPNTSQGQTATQTSMKDLSNILQSLNLGSINNLQTLQNSSKTTADNTRNASVQNSDAFNHRTFGPAVQTDLGLLLEKKLSALVNGSVIPLAQAACSNSASINSIKTKIDMMTDLLLQRNERNVVQEDDNTKAVQWCEDEQIDCRRMLVNSQPLNVGAMKELLDSYCMMLRGAGNGAGILTTQSLNYKDPVINQPAFPQHPGVYSPYQLGFLDGQNQSSQQSFTPTVPPSFFGASPNQMSLAHGFPGQLSRHAESDNVLQHQNHFYNQTPPSLPTNQPGFYPNSHSQQRFFPNNFHQQPMQANYVNSSHNLPQPNQNGNFGFSGPRENFQGQQNPNRNGQQHRAANNRRRGGNKGNNKK